MIPILDSVRRWYCPNCKADETVAVKAAPGQAETRMHTCPRMAYLSVPMVPFGVSAKVERRDREDYVGQDMVQLDANGRPIMSVVTTRDDGQDCAVYAPTATASTKEF